MATSLKKEDKKVLGVFWDIQNCSIPKFKCAFKVVQKIRSMSFYQGKSEEQFVVVCDVNTMPREIVKSLCLAQVDIMHMSVDLKKDSADDKMRSAMRKFVESQQSIGRKDITIVIISGDQDFIPDIIEFRYRSGVYIVLLHNKLAKDALIQSANEAMDFHNMLNDIPVMVRNFHHSRNKSISPRVKRKLQSDFKSSSPECNTFNRVSKFNETKTSKLNDSPQKSYGKLQLYNSNLWPKPVEAACIASMNKTKSSPDFATERQSRPMRRLTPPQARSHSYAPNMNEINLVISITRDVISLKEFKLYIEINFDTSMYENVVYRQVAYENQCILKVKDIREGLKVLEMFEGKSYNKKPFHVSFENSTHEREAKALKLLNKNDFVTFEDFRNKYKIDFGQDITFESLGSYNYVKVCSSDTKANSLIKEKD